MTSASLVSRDEKFETPFPDAAFGTYAVFEILLIVATWPLWWESSDFPAIPLTGLTMPPIVSRGLVLILVSCCCLVAGFPLVRRFVGTKRHLRSPLSSIALAAGGALVLLNQHRLQPWHWLFLLLSASRLSSSAALQWKLMRHIVSTVYVCSALSRIAFAGESDLTDSILAQLVSTIGVSLTAGSIAAKIVRVAAVAGELFAGLSLATGIAVGWGTTAAVLMHVCLFIALGPLGMNHSSGVLLWNLCLAVIVPMLFCASRTRLAGSHAGWKDKCLITVIWVCPLSGLFGVLDNWPAWQLYSPRPESWVLFVHAEDTDQLPESVRRWTGPTEPLSDWVPILLDRWSLEATHSPLYPEDRFYCRLLGRVLKQLPENLRVQVRISEPQNPAWWRRRSRTLHNRPELDDQHHKFLLSSAR